MQARLFYREHQYLDRYGDETTGEKQHEERKKASQGSMAHGLEESPAESFGEALTEKNRSQCFRLCPFPGREAFTAGNQEHFISFSSWRILTFYEAFLQRTSSTTAGRDIF